MFRRTTISVIFLFDLVVFSLLINNSNITAFNLTSNLPNEPYEFQVATDFVVRDVDSGVTHSLSDFRGAVVVLDLFATWCTPCKLSIPYLRQVYSQYSQSQVRIISVDVDSTESQSVVSDFRQEENMDWIVSLDEGGQVKIAYGTGSIPTFYIIDQEGVIQWTDTGFTNEETKPAMQNAITELLEEGPGPINTGSNVGRILTIIAEVIGVLGVMALSVFGYSKLRTRISTKKCPTCENIATAKCAKCGSYTCPDCSTKGCKNCGSRQFIRL